MLRCYFKQEDPSQTIWEGDRTLWSTKDDFMPKIKNIIGNWNLLASLAMFQNVTFLMIFVQAKWNEIKFSFIPLASVSSSKLNKSKDKKALFNFRD